eukprot:Skav235352  [mRNA]  locus=scaffold5912:94745:95999:- [translate_table: standard]
MPSQNSLILTPGVADRVGTIFSISDSGDLTAAVPQGKRMNQSGKTVNGEMDRRSALKTNDFEAQFTISAKAGASSGFSGDGFAFWFSEERSGLGIVGARDSLG